jgi:type-F conjugative transfer system pilin assembly thiol-disulfide isomerase TrbB
MIKKLIMSLIIVVFAVSTYANETISVYPQNTQIKEAFVLFYMSTCPHCQRFDPVLRSYAETHSIPVLAYTLDGISLPSFPNSIYPTDVEVRHFFPDAPPEVPTLYLMDIETHKIIPVLQGEASADQLAMRMQEIQQSLT